MLCLNEFLIALFTIEFFRHKLFIPPKNTPSLERARAIFFFTSCFCYRFCKTYVNVYDDSQKIRFQYQYKKKSVFYFVPFQEFACFPTKNFIKKRELFVSFFVNSDLCCRFSLLFSLVFFKALGIQYLSISTFFKSIFVFFFVSASCKNLRIKEKTFQFI